MDNPDALIDDLLSIAHSSEHFVEQSFEYGVKYIVVGDVISPTGVRCEIKTIWKIETGTTTPMFVTGYPA